MLGLAAGTAGLVLLGCGDDEPEKDAAELYPAGGTVPGRVASDLGRAADAAGCELRTVKVAGREHVQRGAELLRYPTTPPAGGDHDQVAAEDGVYEQAPPTETLVHALEHGRVVVWFKRRLPPATRADLKALFDSDSYQLLLTPDPTRMKYQVAATAWNRDPEPLGTGRLLGCSKADDATFDALAAFRDEHRGNGPEAIP